MTTQPLVSILLPVRNNGKYLTFCLESLCRQTYRNLEIVAIDDASTDNSYAILRKWKKKHGRVRLSRNIKQYGLAVTLNRLIRKAKGEFIAFMSPNDVSLKRRIERQVRFLQKNDKVAIVGVQCSFIDRKDKKLGVSAFPQDHEEIASMLLAAGSLQPETCMVYRRLLPQDVFRFKSHSYPLMYTEVFARCMQYSQFANLPLTLYKHRKTSYTSVRTIHILPSLFRFWVEAATFSQGERLPLRSLFFPLLPRSTT